ncbi:LLM class flavin-dependent oxidoreductase [Rhodococcus wratislaviensis]|nr:LLM class flavin-dependent oxidoreductase [Rhodococcus wratislaviensis]
MPQMSFGTIFLSQPDKDRDEFPYQAIHERTTQEIIEADKAGYDFAWIAEHHAADAYGILPDPLTYIAYLATLTERIRLGAGVVILPLHNIMRLVENIAFVDILTKGRLTVGIGSGYREYEFDAFGAEFESRRAFVGEALPLMLEMFNNHQVDHKGVLLPDHKVTGEYAIFPRPIQTPHPPFWLGVSSEESIKRAAQYGLGIATSTLTPITELAEKTALFRRACEQTEAPYDQNVGRGNIDVARFVYVSDTDKKAKEESADAVVRHVHSFTGAGTSGYLGNISKTNQESYSAASYEDLNEDTIIHGSPETVIEKIQSLQDRTGATGLILHMPPYYAAEQAKASLDMFAETVIPKFR